MRRLFLVCTALASAGPLFAQAVVVPAPGQTAQGDVAVTIYNNDRALVEDKRMLDLPAGRSRSGPAASSSAPMGAPPPSGRGWPPGACPG